VAARNVADCHPVFSLSLSFLLVSDVVGFKRLAAIFGRLNPVGFIPRSNYGHDKVAATAGSIRARARARRRGGR
jgi:hypothetical protein